MNDNFNYCHVVGKTDVGRKRAANEDNMSNAITQNGLVSVVCDGMGGHVGGATASRIAVSTIIENLNNVYYDDPRIAIGESIDKANQAIIQKTQEQPELVGMGSTCVMLLVREGKVYIGHVGDSRIYLIRSKKIIQLTKDHSYVQMLVDCGQITKEEAERHPRKNEITNALGIPNMSPATIAEDAIIPEAGDCFVLCSDGLSGMVPDNAICRVISRQSEMNAQERVDRLVAMANENGGVDNITVQLVEFSVSPSMIDDAKSFPVWAKAACGVAVLAGLGFGAYLLFRNDPAPDTEGEKLTGQAENVVKCDTLEYHLGDIPFEKNGKIVEFVFSDNSLEFKRDEETIYIERNISFDPTTLVIETPEVKSKYNNSLLTFTTKEPEKSVIFSIATSDKTNVHRYRFDIRKTGSKGGLSLPSGIKPDEPKGDEAKPLDEDKEAVVAKADTVYVQFEYDTLEKGSKLLLNYSAKPVIIFKGLDKSAGQTAIGEIEEDLTYSDLYWNVTSKKGQLLFEFKSGTSDDRYDFMIPCIAKDSKDRIFISVTLAPKKMTSDEAAPDAKAEDGQAEEGQKEDGQKEGGQAEEGEAAEQTGNDSEYPQA